MEKTEKKKMNIIIKTGEKKLKITKKLVKIDVKRNGKRTRTKIMKKQAKIDEKRN